MQMARREFREEDAIKLMEIWIYLIQWNINGTMHPWFRIDLINWRSLYIARGMDRTIKIKC